MTDKQKQQITKYRESGFSYTQISKMMDLSINSIKTYCKAEIEGYKKRIGEMQNFLNDTGTELAEYDEGMVRRYIKGITIYEDRFTVSFKAGIDLDIQK